MSPQLTDNAYDIKEISESMPKVETSPEINPQEIFDLWRKCQITPIMNLQKGTRKFYASKPISVRIYRDGDLFFAENENLVVCGTGYTSQEAVQDLNLHIIHFYEYYEKLDNSKLIGDAFRLKGIYKELLVEVKEE